MNAPTRLPAATSRRVRDRLGRAPDGALRVVHRGPHALYLDLGGWCLGVVDARAAKVPCALRVTSLVGVQARRAEVHTGVLHLDGVPVTVGRIVDVGAPALASAAFAGPPAGRVASPPAGRVASPPVASPPAGRVASASERIETSATPEPGRHGWVTGLIGAGDGLTPYGDDVLCGWLAMHRAAGVATPAVDARVRALLHRTTLLSATLLDCAMHGEVLPEFAAWLRALGGPGEPAAAAALASVGHTSGRGLLAGARQALAELSRRAAA